MAPDNARVPLREIFLFMADGTCPKKRISRCASVDSKMRAGVGKKHQLKCSARI
jgi:hypothetical protein